MSTDETPDALVLFRQGHLDLAIPLTACLEVHRNMEITPILDGRGAEGVINLRGSLVPVLDLEPALGVPSQQPVLRRRIIVCGTKQQRIGLVVDEVIGITSEPYELRRREDTFPASLGGACSGLTQIQGRLTFVIDVDAFLIERTGETTDAGVET